MPAQTVQTNKLSPRHQAASEWIARLHDRVTELFTRLDQGGEFREDSWERPGGGGGKSRVLIEGNTFEKAGMNRSTVLGILPPSAAQRIGGTGASDGSTHFFATGLSLVVHPRSPMIPTVHMNVRWFELSDSEDRVTDSWFGGGADLTPFYPNEEDGVLFHSALAECCDAHHPSFYSQFKPWCDEYFVNKHRDSEARGIGGIFFDHLRANDASHGLNEDSLRAFVTDAGTVLENAYAPLVERHRNDSWGERERDFQLWRRGRYVEFNLVHDRGTAFGLHTDARTESVLMSLPPLASWKYAPVFEPDSFESQLLDLLRPRDWVKR